ncbi:MAG TPA: four-carbon acid sugar kinase family protein, partial [Acidisoma sp.]|uniref:four-carbon acid sugar kinase family protein n=1 Tax=Acidisoma sp. TaxID=1872115 RepID=UPI002CB73DC5
MTASASACNDWLILADDLTGACDCAVAFAAAGRRASVIWDSAMPAEGTVARDTDSRRMSPGAAAAAVRAAIDEAGVSRRRLFKKIDSTLRGQPAAEIGAVIRQRRATGQAAMTLLSPSFPATGRTMQNGHVLLHGAPLEQSSLWARDHSYPTADLSAILRAEGLRVLPLGLEAVRGDPGGLQERLRKAERDGAEVVLCDAVAPEDLDRIAAAGLPLGEAVFWSGSGGLALALAQPMPGESRAVPPLGRPPGGTLFVVGSIAEPSRAAAAVLAA